MRWRAEGGGCGGGEVSGGLGLGGECDENRNLLVVYSIKKTNEDMHLELKRIYSALSFSFIISLILFFNVGISVSIVSQTASRLTPM